MKSANRRPELICRVIVAAVFFCSLSLTATAGEWYRLTSREGQFSASFPSAPVFNQNIHKSFVGDIQENIYEVNADQGSFSIEFSDLPGVALTFSSPKAILRHAKKNLLKEVKGSEVEFNEIKFYGYPARELLFEIRSKNEAEDKWGKAHFYLVGKRLFVLVAIQPKNGNKNAFNLFLDSFRLLQNNTVPTLISALNPGARKSGPPF